MSVNVVNKD